MHVTLGTNLGFASNRFPEPEQWARIVAEELGLNRVQLVADLLNPFWPPDLLAAEVGRIRQATAAYGIQIQSLMTSTYTRVNHVLHPYADHRAVWLAWFRHFAELAAELGAAAIGSHFGILSVRDISDPARYAAQVELGVQAWQEIADYGRAAGLQYVYFETMSIPREMADTVAGARELCERANRGAAVPVRLCLDVGHAPNPAERDPYVWLRELGAISPIVHLQQTEANQSRHWPFTAEYNAKGIIDPERVLAALVESGAQEVFLAFEISHRESAEQEPRVAPDLRDSARYWRQYVAAEGLNLPAEATVLNSVQG
jgi:D-erythrulose 1-phosphate 3-epimerase